ncbi:hypothetical protein ESCO_001074 [Escovopsis weberi]|uniref:Capsule polysaccharide biosynthesis protein n=1 Tax=Escovopsis weberi TaxID=150374 RepID=A0A0M8MUR9_ESCWE|nr:hypothetical protein ESCO_001074 [Escovopsis weberi]
MDGRICPMPAGCRALPEQSLDLRPDSEIDLELLHPKPVTDDKNVWFFWDKGFERMHPYSQRTVRTWHRRLSKKGWVVRVIDRVPGSPLNISAFCDIHDPKDFPKSFAEETITGAYAAQINSDLIRYPLLLKYGGVYADAGMIQIGDLDLIWDQVIANPESPYEIVAYNCGDVHERVLANYFMMAARSNPVFERCHRLLMEIWAADGGKNSTHGMGRSSLIKHAPLKIGHSWSFEEDGKVYSPSDIDEMLADYLIQGYVMTLVLGLIDPEDGWNGPEYSAKHIYAMDYMVGSQLINEMTAWNSPKQFRLMSLQMPREGELESEEQKEAREIVEACLTRSWGFKLAHGLIVRVLGDTLGTLWKQNPDSDHAPGTYAAWFRYGTLHWVPVDPCPRLDFQVIEPYKIGPLLREM